MPGPTPPPVLLDCTLRDGNYAVDFKFTEADTRRLAGELARAGIGWIEVGHGLGLGGTEAGLGEMTADDETLIRAAREGAGPGTRVGVFLIPGIARMEHLDAAREAGLDFVRAGQDPDRADETFPFLKRARDRGLLPFLNIMKSYAVPPETFAGIARRAADAGAAGVYLVDSAGGMLPEEIGRYLDAAREATDVPLGFHGHNNLMLGTANTLAALRHGARFLDVTLCGIGRSAGNVPTEVLAAVLARAGIPTGVDPAALLDLAERSVWPLVARSRANDPLAVAVGAARFHSSFLPRAADAARRHGADLKRLVDRLGRVAADRLDDGTLEREAGGLAGTAATAVPGLDAFHAPAVAPGRIGNTMRSVEELLDGLLVARAKRPHGTSGLLLDLDPAGGAELILPELLAEEETGVLGRVRLGTPERLAEAVDAARDRIDLFLYSREAPSAGTVRGILAARLPSRRILPIRDLELRASFVAERLDHLAHKTGGGGLLVYGIDAASRRALARGAPFEQVFRYGGTGPEDDDLPGIPLPDPADWRDAGLTVDAVLCIHPPAREHIPPLARALSPAGRIEVLAAIPPETLVRAAPGRVEGIDPREAYRGLLERRRTDWTASRPFPYSSPS